MDWASVSIADMIGVIDEIEDVETPQELFRRLRAFFDDLGFDEIGIGQLINPATLDNHIESLFWTDFPADFMEGWIDQRLVYHDPVARFAAGAPGVFTWREAYATGSEMGQRIMDRGRDLDLVAGLGIPVSVPNMPLGLLTLAHPAPDFSRSEMFAIETVGVHAYTHLLKITQAKPLASTYSLTPREVETLHHVAAGRSNKEIARELGTGEDVIKLHLKHMFKKMGAANRAHAVLKGVRANQLLP